MNEAKFIILDLDGTLIDSRQDLATAVNLTRAEHNLPALTCARITGYVGNGIRSLMQRALAETEADIDQAIERMRFHYAAHLMDETILYPGVLTGLEALSQCGCSMAVVTNKPEAPARQICRHFGIAPFFNTILGGDSCATIKPNPEPLLAAMETSGATAGNTWMVGDHWTDMAAGKNAGVATCFCRYGFGDPRNEDYDLAVASLDEFADHVLG